MIKDRKILERFNRQYRRQRHYSYRQRLKIYEALWKEAVALKKISQRFKGNLPVCLRVARILNSF